ncbi:hypothetical protein O181_031072 [Austropuccinia psidii MF-1]|uniref:Uncharacterized protein n=1 Tax=Austropuccinia psidii MF-1 TaxID=1389203 RepID=A0A9Q3CZX6_9BASI|nr:hypothetical protein [Austropuccinia psidii MF-1]
MALRSNPLLGLDQCKSSPQFICHQARLTPVTPDLNTSSVTTKNLMRLICKDGISVPGFGHTGLQSILYGSGIPLNPCHHGKYPMTATSRTDLIG